MGLYMVGQRAGCTSSMGQSAVPPLPPCLGCRFLLRSPLALGAGSSCASAPPLLWAPVPLGRAGGAGSPRLVVCLPACLVAGSGPLSLGGGFLAPGRPVVCLSAAAGAGPLLAVGGGAAAQGTAGEEAGNTMGRKERCSIGKQGVRQRL